MTVDDGSQKLQIVCGAPNVRVGLVGVLAPVGVILAGQKKPIAARTVAGIVSNGMMCSSAEIGAGSDSDKIIDLGDDTQIGVEYK